MRPIDEDLKRVISQQHKRIDLRIQIRDGDGVLQTMQAFHGHDWVISAEFGDSIDSECSDATITLFRAVGDFSLAPLHKTSLLNLDSTGTWVPLLFPRREVVISVRYAAGEKAGALPYMEMFRGYIDIINWGTSDVTIQCRDQFGFLQDSFIEFEKVYSDDAVPEPIEDVIQEILDDWILDADLLPTGPINLYVPVSPGYLIGKFEATTQSVADQIALLVDQIGWRIKYLWDPGTENFRLTLVEPQRTKNTIDRTFSADDYYSITSLQTDLSAVRNAITIRFPNASQLDADGNPIQGFFAFQDVPSEELYGRRWMGVTEAGTSIISSMTEAQVMAEAMVNDLKSPLIAKECEMPLFAVCELDDLYDFEANDVHYTDDVAFAVIGYRHQFEETKQRTKLTLKEGAPIGRFMSWFALNGANGNAPKQTDLVPEILGQAVIPDVHGLHVRWNNNLPSFNKSNTQTYGTLEYEIAVTPVGVTPTVNDLVGVTKSNTYHIQANSTNAIPVNTPLDVHVRVKTKHGSGPFSTVSNVSALPVGSAGMNNASTVFVDGMHFNFNEQTKGTDYPPDGWDMDTGTWNTDAGLDDGTLFGGGVTPQYGQKFLVLL